MVLFFFCQEHADTSKDKLRPGGLGPLDTSHAMEIAQLLLSLLHSWGLDDDLDRVCQVKLGLLRPMVSVLSTFEKKMWNRQVNRCLCRLASCPKPITCRCFCPPGTTRFHWKTRTSSTRTWRLVCLQI